MPGAGQYLEPMELALCKKFIPALLQVSEPVDDVFHQLLSHRVKMGGIAIKNPVTSAPHLNHCSMDASNILVKAFHNGGGLNAEAHKAVVKAAGKPSRISSKPKIFYGRDLTAAQRPASEVLGNEARGDVGAHGFWKRGRTAIFDVQVCDTDAKSNGNRNSKKVMEGAARRKTDKYEEACLERHRDFTPMNFSVDGMADKHARATEKRIAGILAAKWTRQYSQMATFVQTWMCLSIV